MTKRATLDPAPTASRAHPGHACRFGTAPPLAFAEDGPEIDRRAVNLRWLCASVLTAVTGAGLIGAAVYVSLQGEATFAELPERLVALARTSTSEERASNAARKADKLVRAQLVAGTKQALKAPMTLRVGDREVIRVRPLVRVASGLALSTGVYATDIPAFDPLRLFAQDGAERAPEPGQDAPDAEVSVVKRDLGDLPPGVAAPALTEADVAAQIAEERRIATEVGRRSALPIGPQLMLTRILGQPGAGADSLAFGKSIDSPFNTIEVRVVPENLTSFGKIESRSEGLFEDRDVAIKRGETFETTLKGLGASPERIRAIAAALGERARAGTLPDGQQMRVLFAPGGKPGEVRQIARVILFGEGGVEAIAAANDRGGFVSVAPPSEEATRKNAPSQDGGEEDEQGGVRLYDSLYETVLKHDLPRQTADELVRVFGYDIDFQRRVAPGDTIEILGAYDEESGSADRIEILSAALTVGGETRKVFRYQSPEDNSVEYFDEQGRSLKKFLIRKPIAEGVLRSGFGYRRHPILGYSKMHTGVDWANRIGTPIMAAGNGTVLKSEWDSGYGRRLEIQHANGYVTAYNHMSRFGRGISPGARVRQGQVVGFVGSTGLSTGPHLHYEVIVNGHFVDPMKIRVPRGRELDGRALVEFKRQRDQAESLLQRVSATTRIASREKS